MEDVRTLGNEGAVEDDSKFGIRGKRGTRSSAM